MRPELLRLPDWLGGLPVPSYGVMLVLGATAAALAFAALARRGGAPAGKAFEVCLETILVGVVAGKLAGWLLVPPGTQVSAGAAAGSGGVWYFGFLAGFAYVAVRSRVLGVTWLDAIDRLFPCVALGHALGRLGCFLAGCCWGRECSRPWAIAFPAQDGPRQTGIPTGVPLHPTQLYEAGAELLLFALLAWWLLSRRAFVGQVGLLYLGGYAVTRLLIEAFRADYRGALGPLSTSQVVAVIVLAFVVPALAIAWRRGGFGVPARRKADSPPQPPARGRAGRLPLHDGRAHHSSRSRS